MTIDIEKHFLQLLRHNVSTRKAPTAAGATVTKKTAEEGAKDDVTVAMLTVLFTVDTDVFKYRLRQDNPIST